MICRYPKIEKLNLTEADQEYSFILPEDTKKFLIQLRSGEEFKLAFKAGDIALETYFTVHRGMGKMEESLGLSAPLTIYVSCEAAGEILEIEIWK